MGQWSQRGPAQYSDAPDLRGMQHKHAGRVRPIVLAACWGGRRHLGYERSPMLGPVAFARAGLGRAETGFFAVISNEIGR